MTLTVIIGDRLIKDEDDPNSVKYIPYVSTKIDGVFFHFSDTSLYKGNFKEDVAQKGLELKENGFIITLDELVYKKIRRKVEDPEAAKLGLKKKVILKSRVNKTIFGS